MSSKFNYTLIIILSIAVIVLGVSAGFFYGQTLNFTEKTITETVTEITPTGKTCTPFEKLEISTAYAISLTEVILNVRNTGPFDVTITDILMNGKSLSTFTPAGIFSPTLPITLTSEASISIKVTLANPGLVSGETYDFEIHSASGTDYSKAVVIP
jgi:hypothetical protein